MPELNPSEREAEHELLSDFYEAWVKFHQIARSRMPLAQKEKASQNMVDAAAAVARFREPAKLLAH